MDLSDFMLLFPPVIRIEHGNESSSKALLERDLILARVAKLMEINSQFNDFLTCRSEPGSPRKSYSLPIMHSFATIRKQKMFENARNDIMLLDNALKELFFSLLSIQNQNEGVLSEVNKCLDDLQKCLVLKRLENTQNLEMPTYRKKTNIIKRIQSTGNISWISSKHLSEHTRNPKSCGLVTNNIVCPESEKLMMDLLKKVRSIDNISHTSKLEVQELKRVFDTQSSHSSSDILFHDRVERSANFSTGVQSNCNTSQTSKTELHENGDVLDHPLFRLATDVISKYSEWMTLNYSNRVLYNNDRSQLSNTEIETPERIFFSLGSQTPRFSSDILHRDPERLPTKHSESKHSIGNTSQTSSIKVQEHQSAQRSHSTYISSDFPFNDSVDSRLMTDLGGTAKSIFTSRVYKTELLAQQYETDHNNDRYSSDILLQDFLCRLKCLEMRLWCMDSTSVKANTDLPEHEINTSNQTISVKRCAIENSTMISNIPLPDETRYDLQISPKLFVSDEDVSNVASSIKFIANKEGIKNSSISCCRSQTSEVQLSVKWYTKIFCCFKSNERE